MFSIPAHKQSDPALAPGQIVNPVGEAPQVSPAQAFDDFTATGIAEGFIQAKDEAEYYGAWQHLINTGLAWRLQGWFGRTAQGLIDSGDCEPAY